MAEETKEKPVKKRITNWEGPDLGMQEIKKGESGDSESKAKLRELRKKY